MGMMNGSQILGRALKRQGGDTFFYIMGGPMMAAETSTMAEGLRGVDVRHEQAAAMMAHAYARLRNRPGICSAIPVASKRPVPPDGIDAPAQLTE